MIGGRTPQGLDVARFLVRVDMPYDVVWQSNDFVTGTLGHLREAFSLSLVLERVGRKVYPYKLSVGGPFTGCEGMIINLSDERQPSQGC